MKAVIFGITGQDGSYLAELLIEKGYEVVGVTRRVSVNTLGRIEHILPQLTIVEGDVTDGFNVNKIVADHRPDEIYNLAAQSHVGTSFKQPNLTWDITAGGVLNILEAIRYSDRKDQIRFYQASSSEMFGKNFSTNKRQDGIIKYQDENTPFFPQSPYGIAKLAAHHLVRNYRESYGIHGSCGILFNHESERRGENFVTRKITKWIGEFVRWKTDNEAQSINEGCEYDFDITAGHISTVRTNQKNEPYGSGTSWLFGAKFPKLRLGNLDAKRDWGHAEDYVRAMWLMLQQDESDDYVVATGETHSIREFLDVAFSAVDIDNWKDLVVIDPQFYRAAEVDYLLGIPKKAHVKLDWRPEINFKSLAERMVANDVHEAGLQRPSVQAVQTRGLKKGQVYVPNV
jgi:GDPmannose 4,6-dehydratase